MLEDDIDDIQTVIGPYAICCLGCAWGVGILAWVIVGAILRWGAAGRICSGEGQVGPEVAEGLLL